MRWLLGIFVLAAAAASAWLWIAPPTVSVNTTAASYTCRSLSAPVADVSLIPAANGATAQMVDRWLDEVGYDSPTAEDRTTAISTLRHACDDARQNRSVALIGTLGAAGAITVCGVVAVRTRRRG